MGVFRIVFKTILCGFLLAALAGGLWLWSDYRAFKQEREKERAAEMATRPPVQVADNAVVMYSLTTCGRCTLKRRELKQAGVKFREVFIDKDQAADKMLWDKLEKIGYRQSSVGTPVFEIGGEIILNNPPMSELMLRIRRR